MRWSYSARTFKRHRLIRVRQASAPRVSSGVFRCKSGDEQRPPETDRALGQTEYRKDQILNVCQMIAELRARLTSIRNSRSLGERAIQSGFWITGGFAIQRGLQFASNLILTRLLFPEAFGIMALATVFLVGLAMFSDIGLKPAVIRDSRGDNPDFLNTAWTLQVIRGLGLCIAGCLLAYPVSLIYDQPILFPLLMALSTTSAISGFQTIGLASAERKLDFLRPTAVTLLGQVVSIVTLVALVYNFRSIWALAAGNIVGSAGALLIGHLVFREHQHRFALEKEAAKSIVAFGKWIFLSTFVTFMGGEGLRAIQGGLVSARDFGILAIAYTIAAVAVELPLRLTSAIGLPALSEAYREDPEKMVSILQKFRKRMLGASILVSSIVALTSQVIIEFLYDYRYHGAGSYIATLTLSNAVALIFSGYMIYLLASGNSRLHFQFQALASVAKISFLIGGYLIFGINGMLIGIGFANLLILSIFWYNFSKIDKRFMQGDMAYVGAIGLVALICSIFIHGSS